MLIKYNVSLLNESLSNVSLSKILIIIYKLNFKIIIVK